MTEKTPGDYAAIHAEHLSALDAERAAMDVCQNCEHFFGNGRGGKPMDFGGHLCAGNGRCTNAESPRYNIVLGWHGSCSKFCRVKSSVA